MRLTTIIILIFGFVSVVKSQDLLPNDFGRSIGIEISEDVPLQRLAVPLDVYQMTILDGLGDLRILNGKNQALPVAKSRPAGGEITTVKTEASFFAIPNSVLPESTESQFSIKVNRNAGGTVIGIQEGGHQIGQVHEWLIDCGQDIDLPISGLQLDWEGDDDFVMNVTISYSENLQAWHDWGSQTLARLSINDADLTRNEVGLISRRPRYIRISHNQDESLPALKSVTLIQKQNPSEPDRTWMDATLLSVDENETGVYYFDAGGKMPVDRLDLILPEQNSMGLIHLYSSDTQNGPWKSRHNRVFFKMRLNRQEVSSAPAEIGSTTDRYWKIVVDQRGGGIGDSPPAVKVGWIPEQLTFVARGEAPFRLVYGSQTVTPEYFSQSELLRNIPDVARSQFADVVLRPAEDMNLAALEVVPPAKDYKTLILWLSLILGVAVLGGFALRLIKQMNTESA